MGQTMYRAVQSSLPTFEMARLWHLILLSWTWSLVCLASSVSYIGTPQECEKAHFVPGYNLGGEGFDIVTMERKGAYVIESETWKLANSTCRLYRNTYMNGEAQKVPVSVVDWRSFSKCSLSVSSVAFDSVETLVNDSTSSVTNDWKIGLNIPIKPSVSVGGSHSRQAIFGMQKSKQDHYSFFRHSVSCNIYRYRLATKPPLSHDFQSAVNALPSYSPGAESRYQSLIDTYGTHYFAKVTLGGQIKAITAVRTCQASMNGLLGTEVRDCLSVEASDSFGDRASDSITSMKKHCKEKKKKLNTAGGFGSAFSERTTEVFGGKISSANALFAGQSNPSLYNDWLNSLESMPDVVQYSLKPLHTILPNGHPAKNGLKQEVEKYIRKQVLIKKCSESCKIGQRSNRRDPCACVCNSNQNIRSNCCPTGKGLATLKVFNLYAKDLYGDKWTETDGSVEVTFGDQIKRTDIISNDDNPRWREKFEYGPITISMSTKLTFKVYDEDSYWDSDFLGECSFNLRSGTVSDSCMLNHGTLFFSYTVKCAPSLGGSQCQEYIPTPMSPSLAPVFYTRNGILHGKEEL